MRRRVMLGALLMLVFVRFTGGPVAAQSPRPSADVLSAPEIPVHRARSAIA